MPFNVKRIRKEMLEKGWCLVNTKEYFKRLPYKGPNVEVYHSNGRKGKILSRFIGDLTKALKKALPEEDFNFHIIEARNEDERYRMCRGDDQDIRRWHSDGGYIRTTTTLEGPGTLYKDNGEIKEVKKGYTLIMTAGERKHKVKAKLTLHRKPTTKEDRKLLVSTFRIEKQHHHVNRRPHA